jgi:hypothetical protein
MNRDWTLFPGFLLWNLWKARNKRIFQNQHPPLDQLWQGILNNICETITMVPWQEEDWLATSNEREILVNWNICQGKLPPPQLPAHNLRKQTRVIWEPPPQGFLKLNFDGASKGNPIPVEQGYFLRFLWKYRTSLFTIRIRYNTNNGAKLAGFLSGLQMEKDLGYSTIIVEGDSQILILALGKLINEAHLDHVSKN